LYFRNSCCDALDGISQFSKSALTCIGSSSRQRPNPHRSDLHVVDRSVHPSRPSLPEWTMSCTAHTQLDIQCYNDLLSYRLCLSAWSRKIHRKHLQTYHHDCEEQQDPNLDPAQVRPKPAPQRPLVDTRWAPAILPKRDATMSTGTDNIAAIGTKHFWKRD
jgi:hypothetical protein